MHDRIWVLKRAIARLEEIREAEGLDWLQEMELAKLEAELRELRQAVAESARKRRVEERRLAEERRESAARQNALARLWLKANLVEGLMQ